MFLLKLYVTGLHRHLWHDLAQRSNSGLSYSPWVRSAPGWPISSWIILHASSRLARGITSCPVFCPALLWYSTPLTHSNLLISRTIDFKSLIISALMSGVTASETAFKIRLIAGSWVCSAAQSILTLLTDWGTSMTCLRTLTCNCKLSAPRWGSQAVSSWGQIALITSLEMVLQPPVDPDS